MSPNGASAEYREVITLLKVTNDLAKSIDAKADNLTERVAKLEANQNSFKDICKERHTLIEKRFEKGTDANIQMAKDIKDNAVSIARTAAAGGASGALVTIILKFVLGI